MSHRNVGQAHVSCSLKTGALVVFVQRSDGRPLSTAVAIEIRGGQQKNGDTTGLAHFDLTTFGNYTVKVTPKGAEAAARIGEPNPASVRVSRGQTARVTFTLEIPAKYRVLVSREDTQEAIAGAVVAITPRDQGLAGQRATTGPDGMATFAPFRPGRYEVSVDDVRIGKQLFVAPKKYRLTLAAGDDRSGHVQLHMAVIRVVNLVDHASTGTGHQASMVSLLDCLDAYGYRGEVHLLYYKWKTTFWAGRLGVTIDGADRAYDLHNREWQGRYKSLAITCRPIGVGSGKYKSKLGSWDMVATPASRGDEHFFKKVFCEHAPGAQQSDFANPRAFATKKYRQGESGYTALREEFKDLRAELSVEELSSDFADALATGCPTVHTPRSAASTETVTFFAAYDNPAFTLLPQVRHMTGETNPWTVVLQPFLWTNQAHMGPRVLHADALAQDIAGSIEAEQLVPIFPKTVVLPADPGAVHGTRGNVDADRVRTILRRAVADEIHLISAYYTQASAADVPYMKLLRVLVAALRDPRLADQKPVVVALLGDEASDAARVAFKEERRAGTAANLAVNTPTLLDDLGPLAGHVVLEHVGRSGAMGAFLHRSFLFVTEGANTWQEVLSVGTPAISARPTGETQPWLLDMGEPDGAQAVRRASEALVTLAKAIPAAAPESEQEDDGASAAPAAPATPTPGAGPLSGHPTEMTELVDFLLTARDEPDGAVRRYFRAWSQRLSNPRSNQFKAAVDYLEQQGVVLNTK